MPQEGQYVPVNNHHGHFGQRIDKFGSTKKYIIPKLKVRIGIIYGINLFI